MYQFEICANSTESCIAAQEGGANRVELCAGIPEGGTTPSYGEILMARKNINIKLHVIIRPRGGDFLYTPIEIETMLNDIKMAKQLGADGVVIGCLTPNGEVDMEANQKLISAAEGLSVTFHRAFDMCADPFKALEDIIKLGCNRILTSGQQNTAEKGIHLLKELQDKANGRIILLAGCGVNKENISSIQKETGIQEFHFSARESRESKMKLRNPEVSMGGSVIIDEYRLDVTTSKKVNQTISALRCH